MPSKRFYKPKHLTDKIYKFDSGGADVKAERKMRKILDGDSSIKSIGDSERTIYFGKPKAQTERKVIKILEGDSSSRGVSGMVNRHSIGIHGVKRVKAPRNYRIVLQLDRGNVRIVRIPLSKKIPKSLRVIQKPEIKASTDFSKIVNAVIKVTSKGAKTSQKANAV